MEAIVVRRLHLILGKKNLSLRKTFISTELLNVIAAAHYAWESYLCD